MILFFAAFTLLKHEIVARHRVPTCKRADI